MNGLGLPDEDALQGRQSVKSHMHPNSGLSPGEAHLFTDGKLYLFLGR